MKKLKIFYLSLLILTTVAFVACSDDNEPSSKDIVVQNQTQLTQNVFADNLAGESGVGFTTTGAWTSAITEVNNAKSQTSKTTSSPNWISISPDAGKEAGDYVISINLSENRTGTDRTATITVVCGETKITITVTQKSVKEDGTIPEESENNDYSISLEMIDYGTVGDSASITLVSGETRTITASVLPTDKATQTLNWATSDPKIASIGVLADNRYTITAGNGGTAEITIHSTAYPDVKATFTIVVKEETPGISFDVKQINGVKLVFNKYGHVVGRGSLMYAEYYNFEGGVISYDTPNSSGTKFMTWSVGKDPDLADVWEYKYIYDGDYLKQVDWQIVTGEQNYNHVFNTWVDGDLVRISDERLNGDDIRRIDLEYTEYEHPQGNLDINTYLIHFSAQSLIATPFYYAIFDNNLGARSQHLVEKAVYGSEKYPNASTLNYERTFRYAFYEGRVTAIYYTDKTVNDAVPQEERKLCDFYYD